MWPRGNVGRGRSAYRDGPLHPRGHWLWVDVCSGLCWVSKMMDCRWIRELLLPGRLWRCWCSWSPCLTSGHPGSSGEADDRHHQRTHTAVSLSRGDQVLLHAALSRGPPPHRICQSRVQIVILLLKGRGMVRGWWGGGWGGPLQQDTAHSKYFIINLPTFQEVFSALLLRLTRLVEL